MSVAFVDTNVLIHILRRNRAAIEWLQAQPVRLSITPTVWMEIVHGAMGKRGQDAALQLLARFELVYLERKDWEWAMQRLRRYRQQHCVDAIDCLIASVCARLHLPLYTHNFRHMVPLLDANLAFALHERWM